MKTTFIVEGTHCSSCKALIEEICKELPGVTSCTADFKTGKTIVEHTAPLDMKKIKQEIESLGKYKIKQ